LLLPVLFYGGFEFAANRVVEHHRLPRQTRNSVKHALTAASVYSVLRQLNLTDDFAENIVLSLGAFNEKVETCVKVGTRDTDAELRKGFYNNWAGIVAARWMFALPEHGDLNAIIAVLARSGTLMLQPEEVYPPGAQAGQKVANVQQWLADRKQDFANQIVDALNREPWLKADATN
jgi:hypothetical protein